MAVHTSDQFSCSVMSDSLWPRGLQHPRLPCPSPTPGACSNSCPLSQWCHPTISSSVVPFSSWLNLLQHQGLFQWVSSHFKMHLYSNSSFKAHRWGKEGHKDACNLTALGCNGGFSSLQCSFPLWMHCIAECRALGLALSKWRPVLSIFSSGHVWMWELDQKEGWALTNWCFQIPAL